MADKSTVYKTWDDGFVVRAMTEADALVAQQWYCGICPTSNDLLVALRAHQKHHQGGFYVGDYQGELVASAIRIPWTDTVFYGSYFYVLEKHRRAGFGRRLRDDVATPYVGDKVLCIDAHDDLLEMNKRKGYTEGFRVRRFQGIASVRRPAVPCNTKEYQPEVFNDLVAYDDKCFPGSGNAIRRDFLQEWIAMEGSATIVATIDDKVVGYGCRRPAIEGDVHLVGPLYADDKGIARAILLDLARPIHGSTLTIDVCLPNQDAVDLAQEFDFKETIHMIRMYKNGEANEFKNTVFGLTSIDVCGF